MGLFGIISDENTNVASSVYYGLYALQHRGQESAGIVVNDDGIFSSYKESGIVNDVFTDKKLKGLGYGTMAIGHVRYGTLGTKGAENAEPIVVNHIKGRLALATEGNLVNAAQLKRDLELRGMIFHTTSDAEIISYMVTAERLTAPSIEEEVNRAMDKLRGGFSLCPRKKLLLHVMRTDFIRCVTESVIRVSTLLPPRAARLMRSEQRLKEKSCPAKS